MEAADFLSLAERLANETGAAERRTAISRAYYAAYNAGVELVSGWGLPLSVDADAHRDIQQYFRAAGLAQLRRVAEQLQTLRSRRNVADYALADARPETAAWTRSAVDEASHLLRTLGECSALPPDQRDRAVARMGDWWRRERV
jgi:hypothetical protein